MFALQMTLVISIIIFFHVDFLRVRENYIVNYPVSLSKTYATIGKCYHNQWSNLHYTIKICSWKRFLCMLFFFQIYSHLFEVNFIPTVSQVSVICWFWKHFNTIILYFIVHCINALSLHVVHTFISYATCEWPEMYATITKFCFVQKYGKIK